MKLLNSTAIKFLGATIMILGGSLVLLMLTLQQNQEPIDSQSSSDGEILFCDSRSEDC
jgi:hypothetical protein